MLAQRTSLSDYICDAEDAATLITKRQIQKEFGSRLAAKLSADKQILETWITFERSVDDYSLLFNVKTEPPLLRDVRGVIVPASAVYLSMQEFAKLYIDPSVDSFCF